MQWKMEKETCWEKAQKDQNQKLQQEAFQERKKEKVGQKQNFSESNKKQ